MHLIRTANKSDRLLCHKKLTLLCDNITDLVLPYNVVSLGSIEENPLLKTITYSSALYRLNLDFTKFPNLSDVWLPDMLNTIYNERKLNDLNTIIHYHGNEYSDYESLFKQVHANSKKAFKID
mgnify:CR=1 FL=1